MARGSCGHSGSQIHPQCVGNPCTASTPHGTKGPLRHCSSLRGWDMPYPHLAASALGTERRGKKTTGLSRPHWHESHINHTVRTGRKIIGIKQLGNATKGNEAKHGGQQGFLQPRGWTGSAVPPTPQPLLAAPQHMKIAADGPRAAC